MKELTREQKIELIADIQKGIVPAKVLQIMDSEIILSSTGSHCLNGIEFTEREYESTMKTIEALGRTILSIDNEDLITDLLKE